MECDKININIENKLGTLKKKITELKSEDDHIKNFVEEMKSQLFDIHNNVLTKEGFESILKITNQQISTLEKNSNNIQVCAYETILQANSKLELEKFPFVLGIKGAASNKTGYIMPYDGFIDTIILTSQNIDQHVSVKSLTNGKDYSLPLDKYGDEFFNKIRVNNLHLNEVDIIQIQANVDTNNVKMHVVQVFVGYNLVNKNIMLKDKPIEDKEVEFNESYHKDEKNVYEIDPLE